LVPGQRGRREAYMSAVLSCLGETGRLLLLACIVEFTAAAVRTILATWWCRLMEVCRRDASKGCSLGTSNRFVLLPKIKQP